MTTGKLELSFEMPRKIDGQINPNKITDEMFSEICELTPFIKDYSRKSLVERIFCIENNLKSYPKCPECSNDVNWLLGKRKYAEHCSTRCSSTSLKVIKKIKETNLKTFGVENPFQSEEIKNKIKETNLKNLGVENPFQSEEIKNKIKETNLKNLGVEHPAQSEIVKEKMKETNQLKRGVEYPGQCPLVRDKMSISHANQYNLRRNEENTDYEGIVYILYFHTHNAVKIGLTSDLNKRTKYLLKTYGEFDILRTIETKKSFYLESLLHDKFKEYRFCLSDGSGRTEFFKCDIINLLDEILENDNW